VYVVHAVLAGIFDLKLDNNCVANNVHKRNDVWQFSADRTSNVG